MCIRDSLMIPRFMASGRRAFVSSTQRNKSSLKVVEDRECAGRGEVRTCSEWLESSDSDSGSVGGP